MRTKKAKRPLIIGITGGMGTGKTSVAAMFKKFGALVLDADKIAHYDMEKGKNMYEMIIKEFGKDILLRSGQIERRKLAAVVFKDRIALDRLCAIVHPVVIRHVNEYIKKATKKPEIPAVIIDAPLLLEAGMHSMLDALIVVKASVRTQIERTGKKTGQSPAEIKRRMRNQIPLRKKLILADYIIDNEGSKRNMRKIVSKIWKEIKSGRD
ncbi:MAG: dephospho-CoA kinase [Candidatus Omnitrophica bacterium]|nr:dephospho-CoA kinase [Candidatus Omnitrophota bacterium]MBU4488343.1 dephospho-CoA kinase [Candidatus Omnitrophota bacterium]MCG2705754.1 dephospho-CoA kinase [Candidatus Omnitrophota bacterium]